MNFRILLFIINLFVINNLGAQNLEPFHNTHGHDIQSLAPEIMNENSLFTGTMNTTIPIYDLKDGDLSVPIYLSYAGTGLRPDIHPGWVGMGWNLNAGGVITRNVKGGRDERREIEEGFLANINWGEPVERVNLDSDVIPFEGFIEGMVDLWGEIDITQLTVLDFINYAESIGVTIPDDWETFTNIVDWLNDNTDIHDIELNINSETQNIGSYNNNVGLSLETEIEKYAFNYNLPYKKFYEPKPYIAEEPFSRDFATGLFYTIKIYDRFEAFTSSNAMIPIRNDLTLLARPISQSTSNNFPTNLGLPEQVRSAHSRGMTLDVEPDVFNVNLPSGSFSFLFDVDYDCSNGSGAYCGGLTAFNGTNHIITDDYSGLKFRVFGAKDIKIEMMPLEWYDAAPMLIDVSKVLDAKISHPITDNRPEVFTKKYTFIPGWKITMPDGYVYEFGVEDIQMICNDDARLNFGGLPIETNSDLFSNFFEGVNVDSWYLRKITAPSGRAVKYNYISGKPSLSVSESYSIAFHNICDPANHSLDLNFSDKDLKSFRESVGSMIYPVYLESIETPNYEVNFVTDYIPQKQMDYERIVLEYLAESSPPSTGRSGKTGKADIYAPIVSDNEIVVKGLSSYATGRYYINENASIPLNYHQYINTSGSDNPTDDDCSIVRTMPTQLPEVLGMSTQFFNPQQISDGLHEVPYILSGDIASVAHKYHLQSQLTPRINHIGLNSYDIFQNVATDPANDCLHIDLATSFDEWVQHDVFIGSNEEFNLMSSFTDLVNLGDGSGGTNHVYIDINGNGTLSCYCGDLPSNEPYFSPGIAIDCDDLCHEVYDNAFGNIENIAPHMYFGAEKIDFSRLGWKALTNIDIQAKNNCSNINFSLNYCNFSDERLRLGSVVQNNSDDNMEYFFEYHGYVNNLLPVPFHNDVCDIQEGLAIKLPDYHTGSVDHWGFYNGYFNENNVIMNGSIADLLIEDAPPNLSFENEIFTENVILNYYQKRQPNANYAYSGILSKIHYPIKGIAEFIYEPHDAIFGGFWYGGSNGSTITWREVDCLYEDYNNIHFPSNFSGVSPTNISNYPETQAFNNNDYSNYSTCYKELIGGLRLKEFRKTSNNNSNFFYREKFKYEFGCVPYIPKYFKAPYKITTIETLDINDLDSSLDLSAIFRRFSTYPLTPLSAQANSRHIGYSNVEKTVVDANGNDVSLDKYHYSNLAYIENDFIYEFTGIDILQAPIYWDREIDSGGYHEVGLNGFGTRLEQGDKGRGLLLGEENYRIENGIPFLTRKYEAYRLRATQKASHGIGYDHLLNLLNGYLAIDYYNNASRKLGHNMGCSTINYLTGDAKVRAFEPIVGRGYPMNKPVLVADRVTYYDNENNISLSQRTDYEYSSTYQLLSKETTNSNGNIHKTEYTYPNSVFPDEVSINSLDLNTSGGVLAYASGIKNMQNNPIEVRETVNGNISTIVETVYDLDEDGVEPKPSMIYQYENTSNLPNASCAVINAANANSNLQTSSCVNKVKTFDIWHDGNPLQEHDEAGVYKSYIYENGNQLIAEAINAERNNIFFTSFEGGGFDGTSNNYLNVGFIGLKQKVCNNSLAHLGNSFAERHPSNSSIDIYLGNLSFQNEQIIEFWAKGFSGINSAVGTFTVLEQNLRNVNGWSLIKVKVTGFSIPSGQTGIVSINANAIDDFRTYPEEAQITSYTYNDIHGLTSISDANNVCISYSLDELGRTTHVYDEQGNILKEFERNIKN